MKINKIEIWFAFTLLLLGIAMGLQIKTNNNQIYKTAVVDKKIDEYQGLISEEIKISDKLKSRIEEIENENKELYDAYAYLDNEGSFSDLNDKLKKSLKYSGMTDVIGPGIVVTIDDANIPLEERQSMVTSNLIIHDRDVIKFVNELRKAGAQAISINDERLISTSSQICAGPTIMINGRKYVTPYVIKAIGSPKILESTLINSSIYNEFKEFDLPVTYEISNQVKINKYLLKKNEGGSK